MCWNYYVLYFYLGKQLTQGKHRKSNMEVKFSILLYIKKE